MTADSPQREPSTGRIAIAVDPGRSKCGVAAVTRDCRVARRAIVATAELPGFLLELARELLPQIILMGNGTGSGGLLQALRALPLPAPLISVEEARTSECARARYVLENPAQGWERLLPRSLRTPNVPYDDYVAVILAERWWAEQA